MSLSSSCAGPQERGALTGIADCLRRSLVSGELSDIKFSVGRDHGEVRMFPAHKNIVSLRSDVFHAMFYGSLADKCADIVDIPDIHPDAFANMLSYIYTDAVDGLRLENVLATWSCADKYDLPLLVEKCSDFVRGHLNVDNCLPILDRLVVGMFDAECVVERCLDLVDAASEVLLLTADFLAIAPATLEMIVQRNSLAADEYSVYNAVESWAVEACSRNALEPSRDSRREMLGAALFAVRFPVLTDAQLAKGPVKSGLLLQSELWDIYQYKHDILTAHPLPFPTEPRKYVQHRVGPHVFKDGEEVFVECPDGFWYAVRVSGTRGTAVVCQWTKSAGRPVPLEKLVRAADILRRGRRVFAKTVPDKASMDAVYITRRAGQHVIIVADCQHTVKMMHLKIPSEVVLQWKTETGK
ncbi:BTB/POZ domain-containing protein 3-like [Paramacrobiotus metropolitanus]|uniref:BTB/POZ domain-containing protein 3-like n=1 Tax=Paramacrobiotus metropolitanus TaxID=2943436 RepID=UPI002445C3C1|nr:BTB/POZ domain-containing protein 3-like [Paramacrobiotus metropolitanus]XP_055350002.1 BTB/POZ domain-containing protein 3-like [Paramacrobiotus metropolitanus]XP_055350003.1 BTB/POZ domain-containing protein 3-like [Paramacrobiotus metropolitanus]